MDSTRTWLCPDCDGYGGWTTNASSLPDPQTEEDHECLICDATGVITATYAEGERRGLHPWTGDVGRGAFPRMPYPDPLTTLAHFRRQYAKELRTRRQYGMATFDGCSAYESAKKQSAFRPRAGMAQLAMTEAAIRCDLMMRDTLHVMRRAAA